MLSRELYDVATFFVLWLVLMVLIAVVISVGLLLGAGVAWLYSVLM